MVTRKQITALLLAVALAFSPVACQRVEVHHPDSAPHKMGSIGNVNPPVQSVFNRTGAVVASSGDYSSYYAPLVSSLVPLANGGANANLSATGGLGLALLQGSTGANVTVGRAGVFVGSVIYVDATNGNDGTALRGRADLPFLTLDNAILATGIASGDTIFVRNGQYAPAGAILIPAGVSVWGQSMFGVNVTMPASAPNIFQPGAGTLNNLCACGNMTVTGQANSSPVGIYATGGSTATSSYVLLKNMNLVGLGDVLYFNSTTFGNTYWRLENCYLSATWDLTFTAWTGGTLALDFVDCTYYTVASTFANPTRALNAGAGTTLRDFGGVMSINGTTSSHVANAVFTSSSSSVIELHGTTIAVSQSTSGTPLAIKINVSGGIVRYNAACSFDQSKISVASGGILTSLLAQTPGTSGTTVAVGAAAGTGATATLTAGFDDSQGQVSITTGSAATPTTGTLATVTFGSPKQYSFPVVAPAGTNAITSMLTAPVAVGTSSGTSFTIVCPVAALSATTTYTFNYQAR